MPKLFYTILLSLIFSSSSCAQNNITLTAHDYNAIVLRGRELQTQLKQCIVSSKYLMTYIPALEAVVAADDELINIAVPAAIDQQPTYWQAFLANIKPFLNGALVGVCITVIIIAILVL